MLSSRASASAAAEAAMTVVEVDLGRVAQPFLDPQVWERMRLREREREHSRSVGAEQEDDRFGELTVGGERKEKARLRRRRRTGGSDGGKDGQSDLEGGRGEGRSDLRAQNTCEHYGSEDEDVGKKMGRRLLDQEAEYGSMAVRKRAAVRREQNRKRGRQGSVSMRKI